MSPNREPTPRPRRDADNFGGRDGPGFVMITDSPIPGPGVNRMTDAQKITLRMSKCRSRLGEIAVTDDLTDALRTEESTLGKELGDLEIRYRAAVLAEPDETVTVATEGPEERERLVLRGAVDFGKYLDAGINGREIRGAEAEFAAAELCPNMIPLSLLDPTPEQRSAIEERAITPAPSTVGVTMHPTLPGVFLPMAAQALRVDLPRVGAGTQAFPVVSQDVTAGARDKGKAGPETAGGITVTTAEFKRVTGAFRLSIEDLQKLPSLKTSIQANVGDVLSEAVDSLIVSGQVNVNNVVSAVPGFFSAANPVVEKATAESAIDTLADYISKVLDQLDGKFARSMAHLSLLAAPEVVSKMAQLFASNTLDSALAYLGMMTMGVTATDRITPTNGNVSPGMVVRHSVGGRVAVAPTYAGFTIEDRYSDANKGETVITVALMQAGVKVLRSGVYTAVSFKTA